MAWSLLIRNGMVIDGTGAPVERADVAVEGERIAAVAPRLLGEAGRSIDASGPHARAATPDELRVMERLLAEALDAGAFGYSTGLVYPPSVYGSTHELIALSKSMAGRGGLYFSHIRGEAATLEEAIAEAIWIGEAGGVGVQIAHVKAAGPENWGKMDRVLR